MGERADFVIGAANRRTAFISFREFPGSEESP